MSVPSADMIETPPGCGYPFEEIEYADIEVEEVSACLCFERIKAKLTKVLRMAAKPASNMWPL